ncbi:c-type cytochrome [Nioella nitratireducens]|uniref:c-type cytochrome n=1 Tax=Nioella nitratireducens TaxID=1287720 RepID=UPI0008FD3811|nr:cytochrome c [Nioella nitratireducens]
MFQRMFFATSVVLILCGLAGCEAPASDVSVDRDSDAVEVFQTTCQQCHGGTHNGRMLADLTRLSAVNGGTFPMQRVIEIIDGRQGVRAHGSPMPVWGDRYSQDLIRELAGYIETIQQ